MKIAYLHQYFIFPDQPGGTRSYDLAKSFAEKGFDVEVISSTSDSCYNSNKRWVTIVKDNIKVHYIYLPYNNKLSYTKRIIVFLKFLVYATIKLFNIKVDLVLATSTPLTIGIPALLKKWMSKTPFVFEVRDVWPEAVIAIGAIKNLFLQNILLQLERLIYKNASAIVPLSTDMRASILARYPALAVKYIEVIENISEVNRFQSGAKRIDLKSIIGFVPKFSILYAGTFGKVNGIEFVVNLAAKTKLVEPKLVYLLIGEGVEKENIERMAKKRGVLGENLFLFNSISKTELPDWYRSVSMGSSFVIDVKELWANSANKFFDTLAAGKPILINHGGWQAEQIRKQNIGYVLPQNLLDVDVGEFVAYALDCEIIDTQGRNALEVSKRNYSLEVAVNKYMAIFNYIKEDIY